MALIYFAEYIAVKARYSESRNASTFAATITAVPRSSAQTVCPARYHRGTTCLGDEP
jgi:hypothetical protein